MGDLMAFPSIVRIGANKIFGGFSVLTNKEFNQRAGQALKLTKEESKAFRKDMVAFGVADMFGKKNYKIQIRREFIEE
jgi:hypothetical protein